MYTFIVDPLSKALAITPTILGIANNEDALSESTPHTATSVSLHIATKTPPLCRVGSERSILCLNNTTASQIVNTQFPINQYIIRIEPAHALSFTGSVFYIAHRMYFVGFPTLCPSFRLKKAVFPTFSVFSMRRYWEPQNPANRWISCHNDVSKNYTQPEGQPIKEIIITFLWKQHPSQPQTSPP